jgi:hypothetical protein
MTGLPTPEKVRSWWEDRDPRPEGAEHAEHTAEQCQNPFAYAGNGVWRGGEQEPNVFGNGGVDAEQGEEGTEHVRQIFGDEPNNENGSSKGNTADEEEVFGMFGSSGDDDSGVDI